MVARILQEHNGMKFAGLDKPIPSGYWFFWFSKFYGVKMSSAVSPAWFNPVKATAQAPQGIPSRERLR